MHIENRLLIKGGRVVNHDQTFMADVYVEDGIIKDVGENLIVPSENVKIVDATGKLVIPGGIDTHTHFELFFMGTRSADDYFTGTRAAVAGGTTMIMNFLVEDKSMSLLEAFNSNRERALKKACCDFAFHIAIPTWNAQVEKDLEILVKEKGINSVKMYMAYKDSLMLHDEDIIKVTKKCKELGALPLVHAENGDLIEECTQRVKSFGITGPEGHLMSRPEALEAEATQRAITIAEQVNAPLYIVHVMSKSSALAVGNARRKGSVVFGEPTAAGLGTDGRNYFHKCWRHSAGHVMSPPLRDDPSTPAHLMELLANGDLELTGTDHCVFSTHQKALGKDDFSKIPNGINGVEERMSVVWDRGVHSGRMDPCRFVAVTSTNAAKIFNMYPRKGLIAKGSDADIVVWDPEAVKQVSTSTHHSQVDFNIFDGMTFHGAAQVTISNGRVVYENGALSVVQGSGRLVERKPFSEYVYSRVRVRDSIVPKAVEREPYTGPVVEVVSREKSLEQGAMSCHTTALPVDQFHHRPMTKNGHRNLQESSFAFNGDQWDDQPLRTGTKVKNPPGGKSSVIF